MQENFQTAVITDDINAISLARDKAREFYEIALNIAALDGKKAISQIILTQFDEYFRLAESSASAMLDSDTGAAPAQLEHMIAALKKIETTLQQEYRTAVDMFSKNLSDSSDWRTAFKKLPTPGKPKVELEALRAGGYIKVVPADYREV